MQGSVQKDSLSIVSNGNSNLNTSVVEERQQRKLAQLEVAISTICSENQAI